MTGILRPALFTLGICLAFGVAPDGQQRTTSEPLAWQAASGPFTGSALAMEQADSGTIFAIVNRDLFRSTDDGITWQRCESQPPRNAGNPSNPWLLAIPIGRRLYASGEYNGPIYQTQDECVSSQMIAPPQGIVGSPERVVFASGGLLNLFNGASGPSVFSSADYGYSWSRVGSPSGISPYLASRDGAAYLVVSQHLYRSTDRGTTWTPLAASVLFNSAVTAAGRSLYAGASDPSGESRGLWRSVDGGATWVPVLKSGFTAVSARGSRIYVAAMDPPSVARSTRAVSTSLRQPDSEFTVATPST